MVKLNFRPLKADEIDCRIGQASRDGKSVSVLLYKDARVDMNILDETVGPEMWQREHYECKGNLYCRVGIYLDGGWVWKADCGTESNTEAVKGESSDSFKRACVNWGIGRALYSAPKIWLPYDKDTFAKMGIHVSYIGYSEDAKEITGLVLCDGHGNEVKRFGKVEVKTAQAPAPVAKKKITEKSKMWDQAVSYLKGEMKDKTGKVVDADKTYEQKLKVIKGRYDIDEATFAALDLEVRLTREQCS